MSKLKEGDVFEIDTPKGKAYLHYIFKDKTIGELIRVLPGLYKTRPTNLNDIVNLKERYVIFFPVAAALKKNIIKQIGNSSNVSFKKPDFMRTEFNVRGEFLGWHIIDTNTWKRELVKELNAEQIKLSPWGVWNDTLLIENLVNDWSLENWG